MLENVKPGEQINRNETLVELRNSSAGAQPKIQKMIQEEEDTEKIGKAHYGECSFVSIDIDGPW